MYGVLRVRAAHPDDPALIVAASVLRRGGLVAFPTETVYGLGANALDEGAALRIFHAKRRPAHDPLIVHVLCLEQLREVAGPLPEAAQRLARRFWPGPLTLVLPRSPRVPKVVTAGGDTVAVRIPSHPVARALLRASGVPIAAPSANRFTRPSPTTASHVSADLGEDVDLILDGGEAQVGIESTIVSFAGGGAEILRAGGLPREQIEDVIGPVLYREGRRVEGHAPAPGMMARHYAPRARVLLCDGPADRSAAWMEGQITQALAEGVRVGLLGSLPDLDPSIVQLDLELNEDPERAAHALFGALRRLEELGVELVLARLPEATGLGLGVRDRLLRAAEGRVEHLTG